MKAAKLCGAALGIVAAAAAFADDGSPGALLYQAHCGGCHREALHERKRSLVRSYGDLRVEVERWTRQTARRFTAEEIEDLVEYLDRTHYRLDERQKPVRGK